MDDAINHARAGDAASAGQALGEGLHALHDAEAHANRGAAGGMRAHILGMLGLAPHPDDPAKNEAAWAKTITATRDYIKAYMRDMGHPINPGCDQ